MTEAQSELLVFLLSISSGLLIFLGGNYGLFGVLDRKLKAFNTVDAHRDFKYSYKYSPISLIDFAIEHDWSRARAEKWLDRKADEYLGVKELQINGDYFYYFGKIATKLIEEQKALIDGIK